MRNSVADHIRPLPAARMRGARLIEAYSPKLGRRVVLHDHLAFSQWVRLEADERVVGFCERPAHSSAPQNCLIDFWVRHVDTAGLFVLESRSDAPLAAVDGTAIVTIPLAEIAAARMWINNWMRMLPVITATRTLRPAALTRMLIDKIDDARPLGIVEREAARGDPAIVRGAIFDLLRQGQLRAPSLHTDALSHHTLLEPAR